MLEREFVNPTNWNRVSCKIPNSKRRSSCPALIIGRLAVNKQHSMHGIGTLKEPDPVPEGSDADELDQTTLMGFDLKSF